MTRPATLAAAAYLALTLAITWPLATRLVSGVTGDWTASLPGVWAMATASQKLTGLLTGPGAALATFWDADIFYPAPKALLYSEPLIGPAVLTLPIWWMTGNGLLIFNLTAIACQALMGLGTFLLTRAFAGGVAGSFVTGLFAVFALTEALSAGPRLEILSLCWLPFALLAWHRYVERGTWAALALTIACAWLLNASSTGYLWVCAPVLIAFAVLDLAAQPQRRAIDRWIGLAIAVPAVALLSAPFILPLAELRRQGLELSSAMGSGGIGAVSAGSLGFLTADLIVGVAALFGLVFAFRRHPTGTRSYVWLVLALIATTIIGYVVLSVRNDVSALEIQTLPHALAAFGWLVTLLAGVGLTAIETRRGRRSPVSRSDMAADPLDECGCLIGFRRQPAHTAAARVSRTESECAADLPRCGIAPIRRCAGRVPVRHQDLRTALHVLFHDSRPAPDEWPWRAAAPDLPGARARADRSPARSRAERAGARRRHSCDRARTRVVRRYRCQDCALARVDRRAGGANQW
jgi:hypothetical protein